MTGTLPTILPTPLSNFEKLYLTEAKTSTTDMGKAAILSIADVAASIPAEYESSAIEWPFPI